MTPTSIIVINWNGAAFLERCLQALLDQTSLQDEIMVVDNDSTDNSVELVRSHFAGVKLYCNERNLGYAGGANVGLRAAQGEMLILLNPDVQVHTGWLSALKEVLGDKRVGVAGCKLYYPGNEIIQHAGGIINFPLALADHYGYRQRDAGQWDQEREVDYVTGAALALRRDLLDEVGLFDEEFAPAYYEESDFCFRVREAGYQVLYVPRATATHHEHAALGEQSDRYFGYFHRNRLRFVLKHRGPQYFLTDLMPAEREWLQARASLRERMILPRVYLATMLAYPSLYLERWPSHGGRETDDVYAVLEALSSLRNQVWSD